MRVRGYPVEETPFDHGSDRPDVEGVSESLRLARRRGGRLAQLADVDAAVDMQVPHHEGPVAISPKSQAEAEGHDRQPEVAEEQPEPLQRGRVEPELKVAERSRVGSMPEIM